MPTTTLLRAVTDLPERRPVYPPNSPRPKHALVSGARHTLCGAPVKAITPGRFDPAEVAACPRCTALAVSAPRR